ncbi:MAG TPA: ANTAR domain-containing protein [Mycobacteriales bacterium]|nr:ANTAR domain-containing protein [Mycobacteriales bacterium]
MLNRFRRRAPTTGAPVDQPAPSDPADLAGVLQALRSERTVAATLDRIVALAGRAVPGCTHASVTLPSATTPVATDRLARRLDAVQYAASDGPCLDALGPGVPSLSADLTGETRWVDFSAAAVRAGIHGVLSCRLALGEGTLGSLNLYATDPGAFGPDSVPDAAAYARHAAAALARVAEHEDAAQVRRAVSTDRITGTAVGLLMQARKITEAEAFELLRASARATGRPLRAVAAEVVARGATIGGPLTPP